jgi:hypothetical protein
VGAPASHAAFDKLVHPGDSGPPWLRARRGGPRAGGECHCASGRARLRVRGPRRQGGECRRACRRDRARGRAYRPPRRRAGGDPGGRAVVPVRHVDRRLQRRRSRGDSDANRAAIVLFARDRGGRRCLRRRLDAQARPRSTRARRHPGADRRHRRMPTILLSHPEARSRRRGRAIAQPQPSSQRRRQRRWLRRRSVRGHTPPRMGGPQEDLQAAPNGATSDAEASSATPQERPGGDQRGALPRLEPSGR